MAEEKSVDGYIERLPTDLQEIVRQVRVIVLGADERLVEAYKWAQPVWSYNGPVCHVKGFTRHVNFGFWRGAELAERSPAGALLSGDGDKMRQIRLTPGQSLPEAEFAQLVRDAVELNMIWGDPTKGEATRAR